MSTLAALIAAIIALIGAALYWGTQETPLASPPQGTGEEMQPPASMPALFTVNRSGQGLDAMPKDILAMTQLRELNLSNNNLTGALPAEIRHLQNLEILNVSDNQMTGVPAEIGQLSKLRVLDLSNNKLTGLPHELGNLQNLEELRLTGNEVSEQDLLIIAEKLPDTTRITR